MKSRSLKSLFVASTLSIALAACGSSGDGASEQPPVGEEPPAHQPGPIVQAPPDVVTPSDEPKGEEPGGDSPQADEPQGEPLPVEGQTGWVLGDEDGLETRNPVNLLLAVTCAGRATMELQAMPASAEACLSAYPEIVPEAEKPWLQHMASMAQIELVAREGCTYVPDQQMAYCGWKFTKFLPDFNEERTLGLVAPFMPTFTPFVDQCTADKPHYVTPAKVGEVNGDPSLPSGCLGWSDIMTILEKQDHFGFMPFDENGFPRL